jgi:serine protease Do
MQSKKWFLTAAVLAWLGVGACAFPALVSQVLQPTPTLLAAPTRLSVASGPASVGVPGASSVATATPAPAPISPGALAPFQDTLEQIYARVSPSVVALRVIEAASGEANPFFGPFSQAPSQEALGSGFVWDTQGDLVTNNHVVEGAASITVIFADGTSAPAKVVGTDPDSDLAVIGVSVPASMLHPVALADSSQLAVGQVTIAIGNPFGEQNTMTQGVISALGRELPVTGAQAQAQGATYTIPDVIQTDAAINPGNSGGVLLDDQGRVIGVTSAIESAAGSSSGIGFAIPANIVAKVIPSLIRTGRFLHPYLGISGTDLSPAIAQAMGLNPDTRGALVETVTPGGPASKAGLQGSSQQVTIEGQAMAVGGDVIVAINGSAVKSMADVIAYIADNTEVGQTVSLTILRSGRQSQLSLTLDPRPTSSQTASLAPSSGSAWLGLTGETMNSALDQAMNLPADLQGVLVLQVDSGSPAAAAGLRGGSQTVTIGGVSTLLGGDVIIGMDGQAITSSEDLRAALAQDAPGHNVRVFFIRSGRQRSVAVTLGVQP